MRLWLIFFVLLAALIGTVLLLGWVRTMTVRRHPLQTLFLEGRTADIIPAGDYHGSVAHYNGSWRGKTFTPSTNSGLNLLADQELSSQKQGSEKMIQKYPFTTYYGPGLQDPSIQVIKIDYNRPDNPWWLRPILDEIVATGPDTFLGKVHLRLPGGLAFSLGYFKLSKIY